jgi:hypothetical protein
MFSYVSNLDQSSSNYKIVVNKTVFASIILAISFMRNGFNLKNISTRRWQG